MPEWSKGTDCKSVCRRFESDSGLFCLAVRLSPLWVTPSYNSRMGLIIGIAGGTASGKTTLVDALHPHLQATGLSIERFTLDRFFRSLEAGGPAFRLPSTGETLPDRNHPESADHLQAAQAIRTAAQ